ncbi:MAG: ABC transporter permease [Erysipelotrichia bacterium]|nr:ABC transporter permease [Erysipelotrichia bacterium]NCC54252.1 ABC transporter permease [Erysipelotrichia bacterium]
MKSVFFVIKENVVNFYRVISIAKYELMADMRDTKLGIIWTFLNPMIQLFTFWIVFGIGLRNGKSVGNISFLPWMIVGMTVWFFISPCITQGVGCIYSKRNIITKMKFPVSILPTTVVMKELFNHACFLALIVAILIVRGHVPNLHWFGVFYYMFCAVCFCIALNMITSVLNMFTRDVSKLVKACMRMLMYLTPILWTLDTFHGHPMLVNIFKLNPLYYIVEGYRGALFFQDGFYNHPAQTMYFWSVVFVMFVIGSILMYKFKSKFIDMM